MLISSRQSMMEETVRTVAARRIRRCTHRAYVWDCQKRRRRRDDDRAMVISLCAKALTTGEIEAQLAETHGTDLSRDARMRWATRARGHSPNEQAAFKCLYLVVRSLDPTGRGAHRQMNRWKPALNVFAITFGDRLDLTNQ